MSVSAMPEPPARPVGAARGWVLLPLAASVVGLVLYRGFAGDDTFIHLQYARNLARGDGFVFYPGEPSYGSTSPLWTLIVAGAGSLAGGSFLLAAKILGALSTLVSIVLFHALARRTIAMPFLAVLATLAFAVDPWLLKWGASGMETSLAVAIALGAILLHSARAGGTPVSGALLGLGTLVRPELAALFLVLLGDRIVFRRRPAVETWLFLLVSVIPLLPWMLYAASTFGDVIPVTVHAKSGHMPYREIAERTLKIIGSTYSPVVATALLGGALAFLARGGRARIVRWLRRRFVLWAWAIGLPVAFLVIRGYVASRYLLLATPLFTLLGFAGVLELTRLPARRRAIGVLLLLAMMGLSVFVQAWVIYPRTRFTRGVDDNLIRIAEWVRDNTPADALIAAHEVGALGYYCERRLVDTAGLVTPGVVQFVKERRIPDLLRSTRPGYYVSSGDPRTDRQVMDAFGDRMQLLIEMPVQRGGSSDVFARPMIVGVYRFDWEVPS